MGSEEPDPHLKGRRSEKKPRFWQRKKKTSNKSSSSYPQQFFQIRNKSEKKDRKNYTANVKKLSEGCPPLTEVSARQPKDPKDPGSPARTVDTSSSTQSDAVLKCANVTEEDSSRISVGGSVEGVYSSFEVPTAQGGNKKSKDDVPYDEVLHNSNEQAPSRHNLDRLQGTAAPLTDSELLEDLVTRIKEEDWNLVEEFISEAMQAQKPHTRKPNRRPLRPEAPFGPHISTQLHGKALLTDSGGFEDLLISVKEDDWKNVEEFILLAMKAKKSYIQSSIPSDQLRKVVACLVQRRRKASAPPSSKVSYNGDDENFRQEKNEKKKRLSATQSSIPLEHIRRKASVASSPKVLCAGDDKALLNEQSSMNETKVDFRGVTNRPTQPSMPLAQPCKISKFSCESEDDSFIQIEDDLKVETKRISTKVVNSVARPSTPMPFLRKIVPVVPSFKASYAGDDERFGRNEKKLTGETKIGLAGITNAATQPPTPMVRLHKAPSVTSPLKVTGDGDTKRCGEDENNLKDESKLGLEGLTNPTWMPMVYLRKATSVSSLSEITYDGDDEDREENEDDLKVEPKKSQVGVVKSAKQPTMAIVQLCKTASVTSPPEAKYHDDGNDICEEKEEDLKVETKMNLIGVVKSATQCSMPMMGQRKATSETRLSEVAEVSSCDRDENCGEKEDGLKVESSKRSLAGVVKSATQCSMPMMGLRKTTSETHLSEVAEVSFDRDENCEEKEDDLKVETKMSFVGVVKSATQCSMPMMGLRKATSETHLSEVAEVSSCDRDENCGEKEDGLKVESSKMSLAGVVKSTTQCSMPMMGLRKATSETHLSEVAEVSSCDRDENCEEKEDDLKVESSKMSLVGVVKSATQCSMPKASLRKATSETHLSEVAEVSSCDRDENCGEKEDDLKVEPRMSLVGVVKSATQCSMPMMGLHTAPSETSLSEISWYSDDENREEKDSLNVESSKMSLVGVVKSATQCSMPKASLRKATSETHLSEVAEVSSCDRDENCGEKEDDLKVEPRMSLVGVVKSATQCSMPMMGLHTAPSETSLSEASYDEDDDSCEEKDSLNVESKMSFVGVVKSATQCSMDLHTAPSETSLSEASCDDDADSCEEKDILKDETEMSLAEAMVRLRETASLSFYSEVSSCDGDNKSCEAIADGLNDDTEMSLAEAMVRLRETASLSFYSEVSSCDGDNKRFDNEYYLKNESEMSLAEARKSATQYSMPMMRLRKTPSETSASEVSWYNDDESFGEEDGSKDTSKMSLAGVVKSATQCSMPMVLLRTTSSDTSASEGSLSSDDESSEEDDSTDETEMGSTKKVSMKNLMSSAGENIRKLTSCNWHGDDDSSFDDEEDDSSFFDEDSVASSVENYGEKSAIGRYKELTMHNELIKKINIEWMRGAAEHKARRNVASTGRRVRFLEVDDKIVSNDAREQSKKGKKASASSTEKVKTEKKEPTVSKHAKTSNGKKRSKLFKRKSKAKGHTNGVTKVASAKKFFPSGKSKLFSRAKSTASKNKDSNSGTGAAIDKYEVLPNSGNTTVDKYEARSVGRKATNNILIMTHWEQDVDGSVAGIISNSKMRAMMRTAPLREIARTGMIVKSISGTKYRLN